MVATAPAVNTPVQHIVLEHVSWETYESLLADYVDQSAPHFTYDRGKLEIVSPSIPHEKDNRTIQRMAEFIAAEWLIEFQNVGSATFKREDLRRGFEGDTTYYIQHEHEVRHKHQIDLTFDPPPDLVVEIEVTNATIAKLPLYAAVGIPEIWRIRGEQVVFLILQNGIYEPLHQSLALPPLTSEVATRFLIDSHSQGQIEWIHNVRSWAHDQAPMRDAMT